MNINKRQILIDKKGLLHGENNEIMCAYRNLACTVNCAFFLINELKVDGLMKNGEKQIVKRAMCKDYMIGIIQE